MYRAVPKDGFIPDTIYYGQQTKRIPSNVPYIIDNIWEWLRTDTLPSRRQAIYASPTPQLALENASSVGSDTNKYIVCELVVNDNNLTLAHLNIKDARYHTDISILMRQINTLLGKEFSDLSIQDKIKHAPLYLPAVGKEELDHYFTNEGYLLVDKIKSISTFWKDIVNIPQDHDGELFFNLSPNGSYTLKPI